MSNFIDSRVTNLLSPDDISLQHIIQDSMSALDQLVQGSQAHQPPVAESASVKMEDPEPAEPPSRHTIDDCIRELYKNQSHIFSINDAFGDTFIYLDPPARQSGQTEEAYETYCKQYQRPFLMQSKQLAEKSTFFKEKLGATQQFRALRRRKLTGSLPPGVKYVVDLTPPSEGDDAVYLTASLCCSEGVRYWHLVGDMFDISDKLVGGRDDWATGDSEGQYLVPEYSPIRHRAAIQQCLCAMRRQNIILDSAVKVWSLAIMVEYLGITSQDCTFLTDCIVTWLRADPNNQFLEVNTEESLRIAGILQNSDLTRDVFALLVGEETLDSLIRQRTCELDSVYSFSGRKKETLPESWVERVEYATKAFLQSHTRDIEDFFTNDLQWVDKIFAYQVWEDDDRDPILKDFYQDLRSALKNYVQISLYACLFDDEPYSMGRSQPDFGRLRSRNQPTESATPETTTIPTYARSIKDKTLRYSDLFPLERTLTRSFWEKLKDGMDLRNAFYARMRWARIPESFYQDPLVKKISPTAYRSANLAAIDSIIKEGQAYFYTLVTPQNAPAHDNAPTPAAAAVKANVPHPLDVDFGHFPMVESEGDNAESKNDSWTSYREPAQASSPSPAALSPATPEDLNERLFPWYWGPDKEVKEETGTSATEQNETTDIPTPSQAEEWHSQFGRVFFNLENFWRSIDIFVNGFAKNRLAPSDIDKRFDPFFPRLTKTLVCLGENEWKYLPLWAEGLDDETGAIYSEDVMEAVPGSDFSTPGPSIHTGTSTWSSSSNGGDFEMMSDAGSWDTSVNLSTEVADGHSDQLFRGKVYTPSSAGTLDSLDHELAAQVEEKRAELVVRSVERAQKMETEEEEKVEVEASTKPVDDTCYDDLFSGDAMDEDGYDSDASDASDATERAIDGTPVDMLSDEDEEDDGVLV